MADVTSPASTSSSSKSSITTTTTTAAHRRRSSTSTLAGYQHIITGLAPLSPTTASTSSTKQKKTYTCRHCATSFRRSEHCIRHERSHTLEKPYGCRVCKCQFSRKDLVVRHERTVHSDVVLEVGGARLGDCAAGGARKRRKSSVAGGGGGGGGEKEIREMVDVEKEMEELFGPSPRMGPLTPPESEQSEHPTRLPPQQSVVEAVVGEVESMIDFDVIDPDLDVLSFLPTSVESGVTSNYEDFFNWHAEPINGSGSGGDVAVESSTPSSMTSLLDSVFIDQSPSKTQRQKRDTLASEPAIDIPADLEAARASLLSELDTALPPDLVAGFRLPNGNTLQRYLDSYFNSFHKHIPILRRPTFSISGEKPCLVLAVCCIGAQYCLEKKRARYLYEWTKRFVAVEEVRWKRAGVPERAWLVRAKLLLSFYAMWSAEKELVAEAVAEGGGFAGYFRAAQATILTSELPEGRDGPLTWEFWTHHESLKRLCYGIYLFQSLISITFNLPPLISPTAITLRLPYSEPLWEASNSTSWSPLLQPLPRFADALKSLFGSSSLAASSLPIKPSAFGALLLIHGLLSSQWHLTHYHASLRFLHPYATPAVPPPSSALLSKLQHCITYTHKDIASHPHTAEGGLWFNAAGLLRQAYIRQHLPSPPPPLCPVTGGVDRAAAISYVLSGTPRTPVATAAAGKAMEALQMPVRAGTVMVRKTAALSWSVEHVLAGWDCILFLLRWMHTLEQERSSVPWDNNEVATYEHIRKLLEETEVELPGGGGGGGPLTGALAALWAELLADTWVWGITQVMGEFMRELSERLKKPHVCF